MMIFRRVRKIVKYDIWVFLENVEKIKVSLKSDKNDEYFKGRETYIYDHLR
jgi:hypothetical protein